MILESDDCRRTFGSKFDKHFTVQKLEKGKKNLKNGKKA